MILVTKSIEWDMGHRIPNHNGKCRHPHGHRYKLEVTLEGKIITTPKSPFEGMVLDFKDFKSILKEEIYHKLDHKFMISECDTDFSLLIRHSPELAKGFMVVPFIPTAENIVEWCYEQINNKMPPNVRVHRCRLFETPTSQAEFIPDPL